MNAAPDGLTLLLTGGEALVTAQLYGLSGVNYDVRKQVWLARVSGEDKVAVLDAQGAGKRADARTRLVFPLPSPPPQAGEGAGPSRGDLFGLH